MTRSTTMKRTALAVFACLLAVGAAARDGDVSGVRLDSRLNLGEPRHLVLRDPVLWAGLDTGLAAFDVTDPAVPVPIGQLSLPSPAHGLWVAGSIAYVAAGESGLYLIDVADPAAPIVLGSLAGGDLRAIWVEGNTAWVADADPASSGLRSVDVQDPTAPSPLGFAPLASGALDVAIAGRYAYVGTGARLAGPHGLAVVDIAIETAPAVVGFLDAGVPVNGVALAGNVAALAAGGPSTGRLLIADIAIPTAPTTLASVSLADTARGIAVDANLAFVAAGVLGLVAFDLADPARPVALDALPDGGDALAVALRGDLAFVAARAESGLGAVSAVLTPPAPLAALGSYRIADAVDAAAGPSIAYLLRTHALEIWDSSTPAAPVPLGTWSPSNASFSALEVVGPLAAVADGYRVRLVDVWDPARMVELGSVAVAAGPAGRVRLSGSTLFVLTRAGIETFDVTQAGAAVPLGTYLAGVAPWDLAVQGDRGFLVAGTTLEVLDVADPTAIRRMASLDLGDLLYGVAVSGDLVAIGGETSYLHLVDVAIPTAPIRRGSAGPGRGFDVALYGTRALVAASRDGLRVVDVTDPLYPVIEAWYDTSGLAAAVANDRERVLLATGGAEHWLLGCDTCLAVCAVDAAIAAPITRVCEGTPIDLDASAALTACPSAVFQWWEDGIPIPGATGARYTVPGSHPPGTPQIAVEAVCQTDAACFDSDVVDLTIDPETWPVIAVNSLRAVRQAAQHQISWSIASGSGESNLHVTTSKVALGALHLDPLSLIATTATTAAIAAEDPPPFTPALYQVYGRRSCTGASQP